MNGPINYFIWIYSFDWSESTNWLGHQSKSSSSWDSKTPLPYGHVTRRGDDLAHYAARFERCEFKFNLGIPSSSYVGWKRKEMLRVPPTWLFVLMIMFLSCDFLGSMAYHAIYIYMESPCPTELEKRVLRSWDLLQI